jgi:hypothetical protein
MGRRFNNLKRAAQLAGGNGAPGSALEKFNTLRSGARKIKYPRETSSNPGTSVPVTLAPFGALAGDKYATAMSGRVNSALSSIGGPTIYGHLTKSDSDKVNPGYEPANAIVQTSGTGKTEEISKITGLPYKKKSNAKSYTVPFGGGSLASDKILLTVTAAIRAAVKAAGATNKVSFLPERWRV